MVSRAPARTWREHRHQQQVGPDHHAVGHRVVVVSASGVVAKVIEARPQHRPVALAGLPHQRVKVRHQPQPQLHGSADGLHRLGVQPGRVDVTVGVPRILQHARVQAAGLGPADQQFGVGQRAGKAADVVADVVNMPDSAIVIGMRWFQRSACQLVVLSPDQVWASRWMPGGPARVTV